MQNNKTPMQKEEIKTIEDVRLALALIRDRDDCPKNIVDLIDEIRYSPAIYDN